MSQDPPTTADSSAPQPKAASESETLPPRAAGPAPVSPPTPSDAAAPAGPKEPRPRDLPASFGRYRLLKLLGEGGMGAVYLAHDSQLDRHVALKIPRFRNDDSAARERFYREARSAATLHHANLCPVHDVGAIDGTPYLTMAFIEGRSLAEVLRKNPRPLGPRQAAILVRKLALGLEEAHRKQIIHRDLKPGNVMLTRRGEPIVMDFGLARRGGQADVRLTQDGALMGTPAYMAPEQARGNPDEQGPACDIYSLGVILYELLVGRLPFQGELLALLTQKVIEDPPPPSRFRPDLDPALEAICLRAIAREPGDRIPSMSAFAAALTDYLKGTTSVAGTVPATGPTADLPFADLAGPTQTVASAPRRKRPEAVRGRPRVPAWAWVLAAGVVAGVVLLAAVLLRPTGRGTLRVELNPANARTEITVDGQVVSAAEAGDGIPLEPGEHVVEVSGGDYATVRKSVALHGGDTEVISIDLVREPGLVRVQLSDPRGRVEVRVDGQPVTVATLTEGLSLPAGEHQLEVTGAAYQPVTLPFTVRPRGQDTLVVTLTAKPKPPPSLAETPPPRPPLTPSPPVKPPPPVEPLAPPPEPVAYAWPAAALRAGEIRAPDLREVKPLFHDDFTNPKSGFKDQRVADNGNRWGYEFGHYRIHLAHIGFVLSPAPIGLDNLGKADEGVACEVVGRSVGALARWGIVIGPGDRQPMWRIWVLLSNDGYLHVMRGTKGGLPQIPPVSHRAIRRGADVLNTLLAILRGRQVEVYVNGVAVCDPILIDEEKHSPRVALTCHGMTRRAGSTAEFHAITIRSAATVPALEKRGAVPKRK